MFEANVTTLAQMNKIPVKAAEVINNFDRTNSPTIAKIFAGRYATPEKLGTSYESEEAQKMIVGDAERFVTSGGVAKQLSAYLKKNPAKKEEITSLAKKDWRALMLKLLEFKRESEVSDIKDRQVMKFPDGYYWQRLLENECASEGEMMQHCGIADGVMYSLRDPSGKPHVTADLGTAGTTRIIFQLRGKQNETPDRKYWKYVRDLVKKFNVTYIEDIDNEEAKVMAHAIFPGKKLDFDALSSGVQVMD